MKDFQAGYSRRDPEQLDDFMRALFPSDESTRVIGSEVNEWKNGSAGVARLIGSDWRTWGDLQLAVEDSVIDSKDNVAWLATTGTVRWPSYDRSLRFAAVLTPREGRWVFRQIIFQWDERPLTLSDLTTKESISRIHLR